MFNRETRTWLVTGGETLGSIALEVYTDPTRAPVIQRANKSIVKNPNKLERGWKLYIPAVNQDVGTTNVANVDRDNFRLTIDNDHIEFIEEIQYTAGVSQGMRAIAFSLPGEIAPNAKVGSVVSLTINGALFLDGYLIRPDVSISKSGGYSVQWQAASKAYPIIHSNFKTTKSTPASWRNISLNDVITKVLEGTGLSLILPDPSLGLETFEKIGFEGEETIMSFIIKVAQKKNYSIQGTATGDLLLYKSDVVGKPVGSFNDVSRMSAQYNYEGLASEYRAVSQKTGVGGAGEATNKLLPFSIFRQVSQDRGNTGDLTKYANYHQSKAFAESTTLKIESSELFNNSGALWLPGDFNTVLAPQLGYKNDTLMMVSNIQGSISKDARRVLLNNVLPELARGEMPKELPFL